MPRNASTTKSKSSVKVHNYAEHDVDTRDPVPGLFQGGILTAINGSDYHPFLGSQDTLFRDFLNCRLLSPTQSNCLNDKVFYSVSDGLQVKDQEFPSDFDKKINGKRQTLDDILKAIFESFFQDGNKFIEIAKVQIGKDKYVHVYPLNNMDCRLESREDGRDPTHVLISQYFREAGIITFAKDQEPRRLPIWNDSPGDPRVVWKKEAGAERTIIHLKNEVQGIDHYGFPSNFAGKANTILEHKATVFNTDNFDNNMFLAGLLLVSGSLSDAEKKTLTKDIRKMYIGQGKGMKVLPISGEDVDKSKFVPFNNIHEGHFIEFDKHNENKIISSNGWSKDLMDLKESSSLGKGGEYLKQLFKIKFRTAIMPTQAVVLNNFVFPLMKIIDEFKGTRFYDMPWWIKPVIPISLEGMLDINSLLTVDEGRGEIDRQPLGGENGKKLITEVKAKKPEPGKKEDEE